MWLQKLQARGLRCFQECELIFSSGVNVLYGDNGVGKTSVLEGISVLSCGKSFRTSKINHIINQSQEELTLFGEVKFDEDLVQLGVQYGQKGTVLRVNREKVSKWSDLAKNLPVLEIHPESYLLITGGPIERRKFLNWGMFHVEPKYHVVWSEYNRALKQRNSCLRLRNFEQARHWHKSLVDNGRKIANYLKEYSEQIYPYVCEIAKQFNLSYEISLNYYPGWDQTRDLHELLEEELIGQDIGYSTISGPHRGDLKITWKNAMFSKTSSRGQQKILAIALKLAQAKQLKEACDKASIYLIDELPAELDAQRREIALTILNQLSAQIIISAVTRDSVDYVINSDVKWFHVEHNGITAVV